MNKKIDTDELVGSLAEFWRAVLITVTVFALTVVYIFWSSAHAWAKEQERLELKAMHQELDRLQRAAAVSVWALVNNWEVFAGQNGVFEERSPEKLEPGIEYTVGTLRKYDVNELKGFDQVIPNLDDESYYSIPIITIGYDNFIHLQYSIDCEGGFLEYGDTLFQSKTGLPMYVPVEETETNEAREAWSKGLISARMPINGLDKLHVNIDSSSVSEDLRQYNYIYTQTLGEVYKNVPAEFAGRTRTVSTSHLIIEAWKDDPREWRNEKKGQLHYPVATLLIRIRHYGEWDLTAEEYSGMIFDVPIFSNRNHRDFAPKTTIELVV